MDILDECVCTESSTQSRSSGGYSTSSAMPSKGAPGVQRFGLDGGDGGPRGHSPTAGKKDSVNAAFASTVPAQDVKVGNVNNNKGKNMQSKGEKLKARGGKSVLKKSRAWSGSNSTRQEQEESGSDSDSSSSSSSDDSDNDNEHTSKKGERNLWNRGAMSNILGTAKRKSSHDEKDNLQEIAAAQNMFGMKGNVKSSGEDAEKGLPILTRLSSNLSAILNGATLPRSRRQQHLRSLLTTLQSPLREE